MSKRAKVNYWRSFITDICDYCGNERTVRRDLSRVPGPGKAGRSFCDKTCRNRWVSTFCHHPETLPMLNTRCCHCEVLVPKDPMEEIKDGYVFCSPSCEEIYFEKRRKRTPEERYWSYVDKEPEYKGPNGDCWGWKGSTDKGYGKIGIKNKSVGAHVYSYFLHNGHYPDYKNNREVVMHKCDNPICSNPDHLQLGTLAENVADQVAKGRHAKGAQNGKSKLTEDQVYLIRIVRKAFPSLYTPEKLAEIFNVSASNMTAVIYGTKTWVHVPQVSDELLTDLFLNRSRRQKAS